jgi:predicted DsbA family dithiol-disulfide isomerase
MQIHIWSDVVCPWCYVGKRRFEHALEDFAHRDQVQVTHRSFQLDPTRPRGETSGRRSMLMSKYRRSAAEVLEMDAKMEALAAAEGLEYHLTDANLTGNTFDAHQLVHLAMTHGLQDAMLERLYRAYFTEQRSLFDRDSLATLAGEAGLDTSEARQALEAGAFADAVANDLNDAQRLGVTGVPFFVVDSHYAVSGAQPTEVFSQLLTRAWGERDVARSGRL